MKKITLLIILTANITMLFAQNVGINDDNSSPDASAMLDIKSSDKGVLVPRVQLDDVNTAAPVTNPATGLLIYANSTSSVTEGFYYWDGTKWQNMASGGGSTEDQTLSEVLSEGNSAGNTSITNLSDPVSAQDAATKNYVDNNDEVNDADSDPTNELQSLSLDGTEINISNGNSVDLAPIIPPGGTDDQNLILTGDVLSIENGSGTVDLGDYVDDADADPLNEIQNLSEILTEGNSAGNLKITSLANPTSNQDAATMYYVDNNDDVDDADASTTNEIQDLTLTDNTLSLSDDATTVDLTKYLDNTDEQNLSEVLSEGNSAGNLKITSLANPTSNQDAATKYYVDNHEDGDASSTNEIQNLQNVLTQNNSAGNLKISNLADPTLAQDAATKNYVDNNAPSYTEGTGIDITGSTIALNTSYFSGWDQNSGDDFSGNYDNLTNKPNLGDILANGSSANGYDIDMDYQDLTNVDDIYMTSTSALIMEDGAGMSFYNGDNEYLGEIRNTSGYNELRTNLSANAVWLNTGEQWLMVLNYSNGNLDVYGDISCDGTKNFVEDHPLDPTKEIVYACLEGPEAATYIRGKAQLINGESTIKLPDYFSLITNDNDVTVQVTPAGNCNGLFVEDSNSNQIVVKELGGGNSNVEYFYFVQGIRVGYEDYKVVRNKIITK